MWRCSLCHNSSKQNILLLLLITSRDIALSNDAEVTLCGRGGKGQKAWREQKTILATCVGRGGKVAV